MIQMHMFYVRSTSDGPSMEAGREAHRQCAEFLESVQKEYKCKVLSTTFTINTVPNGDKSFLHEVYLTLTVATKPLPPQQQGRQSA